MIRPSGNPKTARIVVVGEAPGTTELEEGIPFVGSSGRILWGTAADAGFDRSSCFVTNVVQSCPLGASGAPTRSQINEEWGRLDDEIASCTAAEILLLVGGTPLRRLAGWPSIVNLNAYILTPDDLHPVELKKLTQVGVYKTSRVGKYTKGDPKYALRSFTEKAFIPPNIKYIVACYHPAAIMRTGFKLKPALAAAIHHVGRLLRGEDTLIGIKTPKPGAIPILAIDIETPLPPNDWIVERIGFTSFGGPPSTHSWGEAEVNDVRAAFENKVAYLAFHNASFDVPRLEKAVGMECEAPIWDTMYAAQLLNPDLPKGLERAAPILLPIKPWKHLVESDPERYNLMDAVATYHLAVRQYDILEKTGQLKVFLNMMEGLPVLMRMHARGIRIDEERRRDWEAALMAEVEHLSQEWPYPEVDPSSPTQMKKLLYTTLGLPIQYNKDGGITTDAGALHQLMQTGQQVSLLQHLLALRRAQKELSTYAEVETHQGYVYPEYAPIDKDNEAEGGAGTGRITARNPSITNQSKEARRLYIPSSPRRRLGYADWSQAELRYDAARSSDHHLERALDAPGGVPAAVMAAVPRITDRVRAKNLIYGKRNLAGARTIAKEIRRHGQAVSEGEIQAQLDDLARLFPRWTAHSLSLAAEGRAKGYVTNAFGRRRYFYDRKKASAMVGFDAQSAVADMMWEILPDLDKVTTLLCTIYDGVLFEFEDDGEPQMVKEIMQRDFPEVGLRLPVDMKLGFPGESWGDMELRYAEMKDGSTRPS
jgi:DNA polymerase I-like protein with 3'-5' exonuclease and polymerase domains/uracil-DNA glycosylase